jgi:hypothetical protein
MPTVILFVATLILGAVGLGGGIYETLLIDHAWPAKRDLIQPDKGGIRRGNFWAPVHILFELALIASLWMARSQPPLRDCIAVALCVHAIARVWSFAYFIPRALRFEKGIGNGALAARWVSLSRWRLLPESIALFCLTTALVLAKLH